MSVSLELHPDTGHPVLEGLAVIGTALDQLLAGVATPLESGDYADAVRRTEQITRRMQAVKLKLLAGADKSGAPADAGFTGTDAWVANQTRISRAKAAREVALATDLETGHPATAAALDRGWSHRPTLRSSSTPAAGSPRP